MKLSKGILAALLLTACDGGRPSPAPSPQSVPQIAGSYTGPTVDNSTTPPMNPLLWSIRFTRAGNGTTFFRGCNGTLTLQQSGSTFTGTFTQVDGCPEVSGQVTGGVVRADGSIAFSVTGPASDPLAWTGFAQCRAAVAGTTSFTGTVSGTLLDARFPQDSLLECANGEFVTVNVHLRGAR
jgi:hypothetical protein